MKNKTTRTIALLALLAAFWFIQYMGRESGQPAAAGPRVAGPYQVAGVAVTDIDTGRNLVLGTVDLRPTLERIAAGEKHSHRNDGAVFQNRSGNLPEKPRGYYREYVVPTRGVSGPGPQRLVVGREGELYYTHDHYNTFIRLPGEG